MLARDRVFPARAGMNRSGQRVTIGCVFPARAGMNRRAGSGRWDVTSVPRARGDEPESTWGCPQASAVFPARAGMEPILTADLSRARAMFPVRAGMNRFDGLMSRVVCSPRARG